MRGLSVALGVLLVLTLFAACSVLTSPSVVPRSLVVPTVEADPPPPPPPSAAPSPSFAPATPTAPATATPHPTPTAASTRHPTATPYPVNVTFRGPASSHNVALTFDLGSSNAATLDVLEVLKTHGVHATFFVTGKWAEQYPETLKAIVADGHELGNHSYSHPDFRKLTPEQMVAELNKTEQAAKRIAGVSTHPYWRPPFGGYNAEVVRVVQESGYKTIFWSLDASDWRADSNPETVDTRVLSRVGPGVIVVMHGALKTTALALPQIVEQIRSRGLTPTSLSTLLKPG